MKQIADVREHGAVGNGKTDDTEAIRRALAALPEKDGVLFFPPGHYVSDTIELRSFTTYLGHSSFAYSYREPGGTVISPLRKEQPCLFFAKNTRATRFRGLTLRGTVRDSDPTVASWEESKGTSGETMDGILTDHGGDELIVDDCRIERFSGNGFHAPRSGVWAIRHSLMLFNGLYGIDATASADSWVIDTMMTTNRKGGAIAGASVAFTGNRIEHNVEAGLVIQSPYASSLQITGNLFCCNLGPAIIHEGGVAEGITITGNTIRHLPGQRVNPNPDLACHVRLFDMEGLCFTGNSFYLDRDGQTVPVAMILGRLTDSVVTNNTLFHAATRQLIRDEGGHKNTIIENNPGSLLKPEDALRR